jgi:hypothetical protein
VPICPKCHKLISESHYERHLRRCGNPHEPESLHVSSATAQEESPNRRNWKMWILAGLVIALLVGSLVVFYLLYAFSVP